MIKIKNLTKYYRNFKALDNVNLEIPKGSICGFIGPNGAGKSTTIKCLLNILNYTGEIYINQKLISKEAIDYKNMVGYLPSEIEIYEEMKVMKFIEYNASFYDFECLEKAKKLIKELDLDVEKKVRELSFGNLKKVGIITALMHNPDLIVLDEATSGLDPLIQDKFHKILKRERDNGKTIFFSSHNLKEVAGLCDNIALIKDGKIVTIKDIDKLFNHKVITIYGEIKNIKNKIKEKVLLEEKNFIKFSYSGDVLKLIKKLGELKITDLLIENPELEEVFLTYYTGDEND